MEEPGTVDVEHGSKLKTSLGRKQWIQSIQKRMEFYFSDANLSKDRFMRSLLDENPEIDLSVFLKFNKIRELTDNVQDIVRALKKSSLLSVTEDQTRVYRTVPIKEKENVDECTLYVEQLPMDADHDWLQSIFSQYGKVDYISVPKFKQSGKIKGFAFVEFETPDGAKKALDAFTKAGCKLPSTMLPNQLCSIATFDRNEKNVVKTQRLLGLHNENNKRSGPEIPTEEKQVTEEVTKTEETEKKCSGKKRPHESNVPVTPEKVARLDTSEEETPSEERSKKRRKKRARMDESSDSCEKNDGEELTSKKTKESDENAEKAVTDPEESDGGKTSHAEGSADENCDQGSKATETHQKKRRKKKKKKNKKNKSDLASSGLQVLSKCEWKKLRNKYLELQRSKMNSLKQYLAKIKHDDKEHIMRIGKTESDSSEKEPTSKDPSTTSSTPRVQFTPGVILKLTFEEPIVDVKAFKNEVKAHEGIEYVDVNEGSFVAYVRCRDKKISKQLNAEKLWTSSTVLKGEDEKQYWDKILKDRQEKLTNKSLRANQKGRTKLLKKAEKALGKRIRFDSN